MFRNYLLTAIRNIRRNKLLTMINVMGLTLCFVCVFLIAVYCLNECCYDKYNKNSQDIYRIIRSYDSAEDGRRYEGNCPAQVGEDFQMAYPDHITAVSRLWNYWGLGFNVQYNDVLYHERNLFYADKGIFDIFDLEVLDGDVSNSFDQPGQVVITETTAAIYFNGEDAIGKSLKVNNGYDLTVCAIISDLPRQSHLHFDFIVSFSTLENQPWNRYLEAPDNNFCYIYLLSNSSSRELEDAFSGYCKTHIPSKYRDYNKLELQPIEKIHLDNKLVDEIEPGGSRNLLFILISIAIFLLVITAINYINLSLASPSRRLNAINIHRVSGAGRIHLICQFMIEAMIICTFSLLAALTIIESSLPMISRYVGIYYQNSQIWSLQSILLLITTGYLVSILISIYPALILSRPDKGEFSNLHLLSTKSLIWKKLLVITQLMITTILIISSLVISRQVNYLENFDINYDKDNLVILPVNNTPVADEHYQQFLDEILSNPALESACGMRTIAGMNHISEGFSVQGNFSEEQTKVPFLLVRDDFPATFGVNITAGRNFAPGDEADNTSGILINEEYARILGYEPDEAIGKNLYHQGWGKLTIIGIVQDFNFESLHSAIKPLVIKQVWESRYSSLTDYIAIRTVSRDITQIISFLEETWAKYAPESAFEFMTLRTGLSENYDNERITGKITIILTYIAIIIASFGLLGLMLLITESRKRELGIRKSLGAGINSLIMLVITEQLNLTLIAFIIALPAALIFLNCWLANFAYRTAISLETIVTAGLVIFLICIFTISIQILRTCQTNPADVLRRE
ncbi:MAG: ABC transporter permease [Candidatus Cloacimonetes bacterium]|nr:ABC transporter permease [Candidatus Cloacimonadota bacterium]